MSKILELLEETFVNSALLTEHNSNENVRRHIFFSLSNRIQIISYNYSYLLTNNYFEASEQLDDGTIPVINSNLNSIYIHISGGIDNLAWGFCYHSKLFGEVNENDFDTQRKVGLRNKKYLEMLKKKNFNKLYDILFENQGWFNDLKDFRDPIAHRVILLSSRIHTENEAELINTNRNNIAKIINNIDKFERVSFNDLNEVNKNFNKTDKIGRYYPVFCINPVESDLKNIIPLSQIDYDLKKFIEICNSVLEEFI